MAMVAAEAAGTGAGAGAGTGAAAGAGSSGGSGAAGGAAGSVGKGPTGSVRKPGARSGRAKRRPRGGAERGRETSSRPEQQQQQREDRGRRGDRAVEFYRGAQERQQQGRQEVSKAKAMLPRRSYHRVVLAEFVICVVLVGAKVVVAPPTKPSGKAGKDVVDSAASLAAPMVQLTAVSVVFFVLALMATGEKAGKVAAAFGALVVVGTALNTSEVFTALSSVFKGPSGAQALGAAAGGPAAEAVAQENAGAQLASKSAGQP